MKETNWTTEIDALMRAMWAEGKTLKQIGAVVGVSHVTVRKRLQVLDGRYATSRKKVTVKPPGKRDIALQRAARQAASKNFQEEPISRPCEQRPARTTADVVADVKAARRGFAMTKEQEREYFELLKSGVPIAEARSRLGL